MKIDGPLVSSFPENFHTNWTDVIY
jgi:hypothetical protein